MKKFAQFAIAPVLLAGLAAAQATGAGSNPMSAVRNRLNNAQAPSNQAAAAALDATDNSGKKSAAVASRRGGAVANAGATTAAADAAPEMARRPGGKRDPFISPIVKAMGTGSGCTTGKRCLVIDQIKLKGIVDAPSGMIAVVENAADRTYFLRENDPLFNGMVTHITRDSVVFRENIMDSAGRSTGTRDVVKRVTAPAV